LFHWESVDCKLPFCGRRLRAQVCGFVNILQGLRAVALAPGFKRGEFIGDTKLFPTIIRYHHHHRVAHEKIGPPLIILVSDFHGLLGEHAQIYPCNSFLFSVLSRKANKKIRVLSFCHSLDCTVFGVIVAGRFTFVSVLSASSSNQFAATISNCCRLL
jgi:hypothetical protein